MSPPNWRILVVEDDEFFRTLLAEGLRAHGHAVATANDGAQARGAVAAGGVDCVVTDVMMPNLDGRQLVRGIRESERASGTPRLPVIAATACIQPADVDTVASGDFDAWIIKPYDLTDVLAAVDNVTLARAA